MLKVTEYFYYEGIGLNEFAEANDLEMNYEWDEDYSEADEAYSSCRVHYGHSPYS